MNNFLLFCKNPRMSRAERGEEYTDTQVDTARVTRAEKIQEKEENGSKVSGVKEKWGAE